VVTFAGRRHERDRRNEVGYAYVKNLRGEMPVDETALKHCPRCDRDLPPTKEHFYVNSRRRDGLNTYCKDCRKAEVKAEAAANPNIWKERYERYRPKTEDDLRRQRERSAQNTRALRARRRRDDVCSSCHVRPAEPGRRCDPCREYTRRWTADNRERVHAFGKITRDRRRQAVLAAYGGVCACCREHRPEFLAVDHVNGDGAAHKRTVRNLYSWLKKNNFPQEGFQLLCHNCNFAKYAHGACPHTAEANAATSPGTTDPQPRSTQNDELSAQR
jgi:radical SAM protein with 4Fe4S-binding SPASM domain